MIIRCRRFISFLVLTAFLSASALTAQASEALNPGVGLKWRSQKILISASVLRAFPNIDGNFVDAVRNGAAAWMSVTPLTIEVAESDLQSVSPKGARGDGVSLITAAATSENLKLFPQQAASPAASTRLFFDHRGSITEADIVLNPYLQFSTRGTFGTYDLETVISHELGHLLGIGHSPAMGALMYERSGKSLFAPVGTGGTLRLTSVDSAAAMALYGSKAEDVMCCGSISGSLDVATGDRTAVWVEEVSTGRVVAAGSADKRGRFSIGGLSEGVYKLIAQKQGANGEFAIGGSEASVIVAEDLSIELGPLVTGSAGAMMIGQAGKLGRLPVRIAKGDTLSLLLGIASTGDPETTFGTSSPFLSLGSPLMRNDFRGSVKVIGLELAADRNILPGLYSVSIADSNGTPHFLVGAVVVSD